MVSDTLYILSKIVIAFCRRWRTFSRPMISMLSNRGGLTFCPVTATRIIPKTWPALNPDFSTNSRIGGSAV